MGGALEPSLTQALTLAARDRAVARHRPRAGVLHHSDRGRQDAAHADQVRLARYGMTSSMSRKGHGGDNACIESWHSVLKKARVYLSHFRTRAEAVAAIFEVHRDLLQPAATPQRLGVSHPGRSGADDALGVMSPDP